MGLALIAGQGGLPPVLVQRLPDVHLCELEQFPSDVARDIPRQVFRLEHLGSFVAGLASRGITRLCMAGAVRRPAIDPALIDAATVPIVPRLQAALARGDDGTLREIIALFEEAGIAVIGAHELVPELLPPVDESASVAREDVAAATEALHAMAARDLGQALVIRDGTVIAQEDDRGTDAMLADLADGHARGGVLFKAPKPGQELRVDMPLIGVETARGAARAGLAGIAIPCGGVMVLDMAAVVARLDRSHMFLTVLPEDAL